jgi:hypothetical protein
MPMPNDRPAAPPQNVVNLQDALKRSFAESGKAPIVIDNTGRESANSQPDCKTPHPTLPTTSAGRAVPLPRRHWTGAASVAAFQDWGCYVRSCLPASPGDPPGLPSVWHTRPVQSFPSTRPDLATEVCQFDSDKAVREVGLSDQQADAALPTAAPESPCSVSLFGSGCSDSVAALAA